MTPSYGVVLARNVDTVAPTDPVAWPGGRGVLAVVATTYPTTCSLQLLGPDGATWIDMNGTTISENSAVGYDLPAGQYRLNLNGGTVADLYASIAACPYS